MKKILFGTVGWNIAETTRMIEVAKGFRGQYECHFFSYGGKFESLVEEAGFVLHRLEPREDEKKIALLWKVDRGETFQQPWSVAELRLRIQNEVALIEELQPVAAFLGSVLTFSLSCKLTNTLLFNFIPLALSKPYLEAGLPVFPNRSKWMNRLSAYLLLHVPLLMGNIRKVAKAYGLPLPRHFMDLWTGDINIVAETKSLSLLKELPKDWYFSGALFAHLDTKIPTEVQELLSNTTLPKVYFAMGSSANRKVLLKVLSALEGLDCCFIAPIQSHLQPGDFIPNNVHVTGWLPALEVTSQVDFALIHGGQGTVQTTVLAGVPFIGVGMQPEQEMNIYLYQQFGSAIQLYRNQLSKKKIQAAIHEMLTNATYRKKALEAKTLLSEINTVETVVSIFEEVIRERTISS